MLFYVPCRVDGLGVLVGGARQGLELVHVPRHCQFPIILSPTLKGEVIATVKTIYDDVNLGTFHTS